MAATRAFALKDTINKERFADAATVVSGRRVRLSDLLRNDDGELDLNTVIVTNDPREQAALDRITSINEVDVPAQKTPAAPTPPSAPAASKPKTPPAGGAPKEA